jgi:hypothetical protein
MTNTLQKKKQVEDYNIFTCSTCKDHPIFSDISDVRKHLYETHDLSKEDRCSKTALMFIDAKTFTRQAWQWTFAKADGSGAIIMTQDICTLKGKK